MEKKREVKIGLIGGHLTPALAVADELKKRGVKLVWFGVKHTQTADNSLSAEYEAVTEREIDFIPFKTGKLWRKWTFKTLLKGLKNLVLIPIGSINAYVVLLRHRPDLLVSFGGHTALPLIIAAKVLRIKTATHEQTVTAGLSNKLLARFSDRIYISWPDSLKQFPEQKTLLTGNPVRREVLEVKTKEFNFTEQLPVIYITGGNQGANTFNWRLRHTIADILEVANVIQQTGASQITNDFKKALEVKESLSERLQNRYIVRDRIFGTEIGEAFAKADLVVARSGANTITELLTLGKPSVLIPIPWSSGNEQQKNAELVASTGLAQVLIQYDAMPPEELRDTILTALKTVTNDKAFNDKTLNKAKQTATQLVQPLATEMICDDLLAQLV